MKKGLLSAFLVIVVAASSFAQDAAFSQGSSTISVGYGFGSIWKTLFKLSGAKVSTTGPIALVYEYGAAEKISVGISLGYSKLSAKFDDGDPADAETETLTNISALARANYHFGSSEKFDPYIGIGAGYYHFKFEAKDANGNTEPDAVFSIPGAFGFSGQLGAKYYFSPKFGLYAEVGYVAGSFAQIGLTAKF